MDRLTINKALATRAPQINYDRTGRVLASVICLLTFLSGCDNKPPPTGPINQNLPTTKLQIGGRQFTLEIASDDRTRQVGLMSRKSMQQDHGIIFVFPDERRLSFWMDQTLIPLDIIYVDRDGEVVSIHSMKPLDLRQVTSARPAMYAIELNEGAAQRAGVKPGDRLKIPSEVAVAHR